LGGEKGCGRFRELSDSPSGVTPSHKRARRVKRGIVQTKATWLQISGVRPERQRGVLGGGRHAWEKGGPGQEKD